ncbi:MAG: beta-galactosidase [Opitutales bacterium]|nr:beta-galactosidase [Opitutales bacterium]
MLVEPGAAGKHGFIQITDQGELCFEKCPEKSVRFFAAASGHMGWFDYNTEALLERYTDQIVRGGYNAYRPHFLDVMLMQDAEKTAVFNPEKLELWDKFSAMLKRKGVYLYLDLSTSSSLFMPRKAPSDRSEENQYLAMYFESRAREEWLLGVSNLLTHVNPHTGNALIDEPQVIAMEMRNEAGLLFQAHITQRRKWKIPASLHANWHLWLEKRYQSIKTLKTNWESAPFEALELDSIQKFADVPIPPSWGAAKASMDFAEFAYEAEQKLLKWQVTQLRKLGVKHALIDYNNGFNAAAALIRGKLDIIEAHGYHQHPTGYYVGASMQNTSALAEGGAFITRINAGKYSHTPLFVTEWGMPYWNNWRHEAVLIAPAMASLQNWSLSLQHANNVLLDLDHGMSSEELRPFRIAADPTLKAAERATALLFKRADIKANQIPIRIQMDKQIAFESVGASLSIDSTIVKAAWVGDVALTHDSENEPSETLLLKPQKGSAIVANIGAETVLDSRSGKSSNWVKTLRDRGLLSKENRTNLSKQIWESETGEVFLDEQNRTLTIKTPKSEGAVLSPESPELKLTQLVLKNKGEPSTVLISSIDNQPLKSSKRLLLIAIGDSKSSGMEFEDESQRKVTDLGQLPVLICPLSIDIKLQTAHAEEMEIWGLAENGKRLSKIPAAANGETLSFTIDTHKGTAKGPYFEISVE